MITYSDQVNPPIRHKARYVRCHFAYKNFFEYGFEDAIFIGCYFSNCHLDDTVFLRCYLQGVVFESCGADAVHFLESSVSANIALSSLIIVAESSYVDLQFVRSLARIEFVDCTVDHFGERGSEVAIKCDGMHGYYIFGVGGYVTPA
jgi:hypothetical protein